LFTDFDNDGWPDLIMAGEWMPITFLKNDHGKFVNITLNRALPTNWACGIPLPVAISGIPVVPIILWATLAKTACCRPATSTPYTLPLKILTAVAIAQSHQFSFPDINGEKRSFHCMGAKIS
jgi:hypothetical protein